METDVARWRTPGGADVSLHYRPGTNDWNTITSTMAPEDEYKAPVGRTGVLVDIGAYVGSVAVALAKDNPLARVIAIEPVPPNAEMVRRNAYLNNVDVLVLEAAVGQGQVEVWYGYSGNEAAEHHRFVGNSSLAYDHGGILPHESITYQGITLADLVDTFGTIEWLKIDTEGGEWSFLESDRLLSVRTIVGEWHPVRGHAQTDIVALLSATHDVEFSGPVEGPGGFAATLR